MTEKANVVQQQSKLLHRVVVQCIVVLVTVYMTILVSLMSMEARLVFPGARGGDFDRTDIEHRDVWITTAEGNRIHAWYLKSNNTGIVPVDQQYALIMSHGNAQNISTMLEEAERYRSVHHLSVLVYDYRGFGKTPGPPSEQSALVDAEAAHDWLRQETGLPAERIFVFGRSLGGGIAVHLASKFNAAGLILDRTFSSVSDVAADKYWYVPVKAIIENSFNSTARIKDYHGPLLQLHGTIDEVLPIQFARRLQETSPSTQKRLIETPDTTHLDPWPIEFTAATDSFIEAIKAGTLDFSAESETK